MDVPHGPGPAPGTAAAGATGTREPTAADESAPRDDDERFIVGLVLTYYRRHPQRARTRLLDLLGEVLTPTPTPSANVAPAPRHDGASGSTGAASRPLAPAAEDAHALWLRSQSGVAPLKRKK